MSLNPARLRMVEIGNLYAAHASQFAYSEGPDRAEIYSLTYPELVARLNAGETIIGDCSSTYEATREFAGCVNLPPLGYTGTELENMPKIPLAEALEGDAIVFGEPPGLHVVWVRKADPTNPLVDSHGHAGFDQSDLQTMWSRGFPGQPITVLSLKPFLPPVPLSYHYNRFDHTLIPLANDVNSERAVVENYDRYRRHPFIYRSKLARIHANLNVLIARVENNELEDHDPAGHKFWRAWRLGQLLARFRGEVVKPT